MQAATEINLDVHDGAGGLDDRLAEAGDGLGTPGGALHRLGGPVVRRCTRCLMQ